MWLWIIEMERLYEIVPPIANGNNGERKRMIERWADTFELDVGIAGLSSCLTECRYT